MTEQALALLDELLVYVDNEDEKRRQSFPRIILWATVRSCSTLFERIMMEIKPKGKIFNEPYTLPFIFGPERVWHIFDSELDTTYKDIKNIKFSDITKQLCDDYDRSQYSFLFSKEMAMHIVRSVKGPDFYKNLLKNELSYPNFYHTFLIRNPWKVGASYYKALKKSGHADSLQGDDARIGFEYVLDVYNACVELKFENILIIDSDDLLQNPTYYMKKYCQNVGLTKQYSDDILKWRNDDEEVIKHFEAGAMWHEAVLKSTGIETKSKEEMQQAIQTAMEYCQSQLPKVLLDSIQLSMEPYQILFEKRLR